MGHSTSGAAVTAEPATADRASERFELLSETLRSFAEATSEPATLLDAIVRGIADALRGFCSIVLLSEDGERLVPAALFDRDPARLSFLRRLAGVAPLRLDEGHPLVLCLQARGPILTTDFSAETLGARIADPEDLRAALAMCVRGMVMAPMRVQGKSLGALSVVRHGPNAMPFETADLQLAQCLADHAALALTNARLFQHAERELSERKRAEARLRLLTDLSRQFASTTDDLQGLLDLIARRLGEIIGQGCMVRLITSDAKSLEGVGSVYHPDAEIAAALLDIVRNSPQSVGDGIGGTVIATGQPVLVPEDDFERIAPRVDPRVHSLARAIGLRGFASVPLSNHGAVIGVASVFHTRKGAPYTEDDLVLLKDVASHAALALSNSRLFADRERQLQEREKAEQALQRAEQQLRQSQKMEAVGRLAGGVAHDFNNLLSVVLGYCNLMMDELHPSDPMRDDLSEVLRAGERAADLTRQLLAFSRQQVFAPRVLNLNTVIASMEKLIRRLLGENIALHMALEPALGAVKSDPSQLEQVLMNLVVNARDAMPEGGSLTLETHNVELAEPEAREIGVSGGPYVRLTVRDTGVGMDQATQLRVFEPFFTTKEKGKGTGLGLSTAFGIVQQSGGSIWVASELGRGSAFHVILHRSYEAQKSDPPKVAVTRVRGTETVLLVEDEDPVRTVIRGVLERNGYRVIEARSGAQALSLASSETGPIQLLLTDIMMPQMSGRQLAERLQPLRPDMKVLYVSGYTDDSVMHHGLLGPHSSFLAKPLTPDVLLRKVREVLEAGVIECVGE